MGPERSHDICGLRVGCRPIGMNIPGRFIEVSPCRALTDRQTHSAGCWIPQPASSPQTRPLRTGGWRGRARSDCICRALISNIWKTHAKKDSGLCLTPRLFSSSEQIGGPPSARARPAASAAATYDAAWPQLPLTNGPAPHAVSDAGSALAAAPTRPAGCWVPLHIRGDELHERSRECCQCVRLPRLR